MQFGSTPVLKSLTGDASSILARAFGTWSYHDFKLIVHSFKLLLPTFFQRKDKNVCTYIFFLESHLAVYILVQFQMVLYNPIEEMSITIAYVILNNIVCLVQKHLNVTNILFK